MRGLGFIFGYKSIYELGLWDVDTLDEFGTEPWQVLFVTS